MYDTMKAGLLAIYLLAIVAAFGILPPGFARGLQWLAVVLLAAHIAELLLVFRTVRRYPGPLIDSVALTLLFGFLHWKPLGKNP
jgi:hypothetical protein